MSGAYVPEHCWHTEPLLTDEDECEHASVMEASGYPTGPSGRCEVYLVCEDCGAELGRAGWDGVL